MRVSVLLFSILCSSILAAEDALPRVLLLGDFVYNEPSQHLQKELKGKAEIHYPRLGPGIVFNSASALEHFDTIIGKGEWDLIHFNVGLGDLIHRVPGMKSFRVYPIHVGGVKNTSPEQYEKNLQELVKRLKSTGAKLVWASTTPIRHSRTNVFEIKSEIEYNAIAAKVMKQNGIPINDMYTFAKGVMNMDKPASHGADPFNFDKKPIHPPILKVIQQELGLSLASTENSN